MIKEIEDGWWLGKKNGQLGAFPSNFVELLDSGPPSLGNLDIPSMCPDPQRHPKLSSLTYDSPPDYLRTASCPETCRVLFDYEPEAPDELALRRGDLVKVIRKTTEDKGWWEGECQGRRGVFPDNFVLPPPPIKRLVPRKVVPQESAPVKEPHKTMPRVSLSTSKKLSATTTSLSKAKMPWIPNGDGQKRPSRDSGANGSFLSGSPGLPGKKRSRTQVPRQHPTSIQEEELSSLARSPSRNKTPTGDKITSPEKTPPLDRVPSPRKTRTLSKASIAQKISSVEKTPALETPTKDEALAMTSEDTRIHHFSPEESLQRAQSGGQVSMPEEPCISQQGDGSPLQSKLERDPGSVSALEEDPSQGGAAAFLHANQGTTPKLLGSPPREPLRDITPEEQMPPEERHSTPHTPHTAEPTPAPHSGVPQNSESRSDPADGAALRQEVESLKSALQQLELQLEKQMTEVWEELHSEREQRRWLEAQMLRKAGKSPTRGFKDAQTQTQTQ
ncbi:SH3 domain-containing protein 21-like [Perognathus longimembris pacificus]|uniref:SH3 domain-containing protein 21-like n=1 Tax=Perognathus longimembris pacificus TaxID=214514 RepID=UPI002019C0FB|nr:SH3 domain-containing protein 21-like [Perognathus longimembris pacificus]